MISKDNIEEIKEALYMNCLSSKFCCLCIECLSHDKHCFHPGSLKIGGLETLQKLINNVLNDTTPQKFRIYEACKYLESQGYLEYKISTNILAGTTFFCTMKLFLEMRDKQEQPQETEQAKLWR